MHVEQIDLGSISSQPGCSFQPSGDTDKAWAPADLKLSGVSTLEYKFSKLPLDVLPVAIAGLNKHNPGPKYSPMIYTIV